MDGSKIHLFVILGPTASGKNEVAVSIAPRLNAEIISVDSMKVYRGLDIGTAKPQETAQIKYHLINIVESWEPFSLDLFIEHCDRAIKQIVKSEKQPDSHIGLPEVDVINDDELLHYYEYGGFLSGRGGWFITNVKEPNKVLKVQQVWMS